MPAESRRVTGISFPPTRRVSNVFRSLRQVIRVPAGVLRFQNLGLWLKFSSRCPGSECACVWVLTSVHGPSCGTVSTSSLMSSVRGGMRDAHPRGERGNVRCTSVHPYLTVYIVNVVSLSALCMFLGGGLSEGQVPKMWHWIAVIQFQCINIDGVGHATSQ